MCVLFVVTNITKSDFCGNILSLYRLNRSILHDQIVNLFDILNKIYLFFIQHCYQAIFNAWKTNKNQNHFLLLLSWVFGSKLLFWDIFLVKTAEISIFCSTRLIYLKIFICHHLSCIICCLNIPNDADPKSDTCLTSQC